MENFEFDVLEDDELDVLELVLIGIPRKINACENIILIRTMI